MTVRRCPGPVELERAFWSGDDDARAHAADCPRCGPAWTEIGALRDVGRRIAPTPPSPERREDIRTVLLASSPAALPAVVAPVRRTWLPLAAALAAAVAWLLWPRAPAPRAADILAHDGARYLVSSSARREVVRLVDGTLTIVGGRDRAHLITGDAELELADAALDVTAEADRLVAIRVMRGRVDVRPTRGDAFALSAGESWRALLTDASDAVVVPPDAGPPDAGVPDAAPTSIPAPRPAALVAELAPAIEAPPALDAGIPRAARGPAEQAFDDGWTAVRAGDFATAAAAFERAAATVDPRLEEDARYWQAVALARAGDPPAATRAFSAFVDAYPSSPHAGEASVALGWLLVDRGDPALAIRRFRAAIADPSPTVRSSAAAGLRAAGAPVTAP